MTQEVGMREDEDDAMKGNTREPSFLIRNLPNGANLSVFPPSHSLSQETTDDQILVYSRRGKTLRRQEEKNNSHIKREEDEKRKLTKKEASLLLCHLH